MHTQDMHTVKHTSRAASTDNSASTCTYMHAWTDPNKYRDRSMHDTQRCTHTEIHVYTHTHIHTQNYCQTRAPRDTQRAMHTPEGSQLSEHTHTPGILALLLL